MHGHGRFIEMQSNLTRKKRHRTNQGSNFLGDSFSNRDNERAPIKSTPASQKIIFPQEQTNPCYDTGQMKPVKFFQHRN